MRCEEIPPLYVVCAPPHLVPSPRNLVSDEVLATVADEIRSTME